MTVTWQSRRLVPTKRFVLKPKYNTQIQTKTQQRNKTRTHTQKQLFCLDATTCTMPAHERHMEKLPSRFNKTTGFGFEQKRAFRLDRATATRPARDRHMEQLPPRFDETIGFKQIRRFTTGTMPARVRNKEKLPPRRDETELIGKQKGERKRRFLSTKPAVRCLPATATWKGCRLVSTKRPVVAWLQRKQSFFASTKPPVRDQPATVT